MKLSEGQLRDFGHAGFLVLPHLFSQAEVAAITAELPALLAEECLENIREKESGELRTAMGLHLRNAVFGKLAGHINLTRTND